MTTLTQFQPSDQGVFQFQPTLDNSVFTVQVTWNVYAERYYFNLYTLSGSLVHCMPLIGCPNDYPISLLPPLNPITGLAWVSNLYFLDPEQTFAVVP